MAKQCTKCGGAGPFRTLNAGKPNERLHPHCKECERNARKKPVAVAAPAPATESEPAVKIATEDLAPSLTPPETAGYICPASVDRTETEGFDLDLLAVADFAKAATAEMAPVPSSIYVGATKQQEKEIAEVVARGERWKRCPKAKCGHVVAIGNEQVEKVFGLRCTNGRKRAQSNCRKCRSGGNK